MAEVKILKDCGVAGKACKKGDKVEVSDRDAQYLIGLGKAEKIEPKAKKDS